MIITKMTQQLLGLVCQNKNLKYTSLLVEAYSITFSYYLRSAEWELYI